MAGDARPPSVPGPAAVSIHDDRNVQGRHVVPCLTVPHGLDQRFHVVQVALQRSFALRGEPVLGLGDAAVEGLLATDVAGVFELSAVDGDVAVRGAEQFPMRRSTRSMKMKPR